WKEPAFDDGAWQEVALPATWESHSNYTQDNVYGWFRRRIEVPANLLGKDVLLALGKIDDVDETFVNGVRVGSMGAFPPAFATAYDQPRIYTVPAGLLKGDGSDLVAVRVFDAQGAGGMYEAAAPAVRGGPFDSYALGGGSVGFTVGGVGWYRKAFALPERWKGRRVRVTFDGVYMNCQIWCNGKRVAEHPYGYTSFHVDLSDHVTFGQGANVLAVRVDARGITSRWYPGAGIYRHARLTAADPIHVEPWGVCVSTQSLGAGEATVSVRTAVRNDSGRRRKLAIRSRLVDPSGKTAATGVMEQSVEAGGTHEFSQVLTVKTPALWSPESPALYRLETALSVAGKPVDATATTCGIRTVQVDAENGLRINGQPVKLLGACVHHDNGALGSCTYDRAEERRVERLQAAGFNAIRTAHNPPSPAFLDACDRLGMLVMDEAFDTWHLCKGPQDYGMYFKTWWKRDLQSMVFRDRHHPSVIFWSIGNEVAAQEKPEALKLTKTLANYVRKLDPTRPVAQAFMPFVPWDDLFVGFDALDVCGYNYKVERYRPDHETRPRQVIAGTESYPKDTFTCLTSVKDLPYVIGDFVWTGYDYLGEAACRGRRLTAATWTCAGGAARSRTTARPSGANARSSPASSNRLGPCKSPARAS
ncbi:MAG: hypothetical protein NT031_01585, partial [Planctomycetota bacterium]|nr:hypothetical protein [Planctomycetota bacterium]